MALPLNKGRPLNSVVTAILSISDVKAENSFCNADRCTLEKIPLADCSASSASRLNTLVICPIAWSAIVITDTPSLALRIATPAIFASAFKFSAMANPAASSFALLILSQEDKRSNKV